MQAFLCHFIFLNEIIALTARYYTIIIIIIQLLLLFDVGQNSQIENLEMGHCNSSDKLDNHELRIGKLEKDFDNIQTPTGKCSVFSKYIRKHE